MSNELNVCTDKLISFISEQLSIKESIIESVLDSEMDFLDSKDLLSDHPEDESGEHVFINTIELIKFIEDDIKMDVRIISVVLEKEVEYLEKLGNCSTSLIE